MNVNAASTRDPACPPTNLRLRRGVIVSAFLAVCFSFTSCDAVKFYEKERLAGSLMAFSESPTEINFLVKNTYSREGSAGGIGSSAGGGCGCY
jgi:Domain of unknown function (DUF4266)